ncbi:g10191 [Coccomyxa elongata]
MVDDTTFVQDVMGSGIAMKETMRQSGAPPNNQVQEEQALRSNRRPPRRKGPSARSHCKLKDVVHEVHDTPTSGGSDLPGADGSGGMKRKDSSPSGTDGSDRNKKQKTSSDDSSEGSLSPSGSTLSDCTVAQQGMESDGKKPTSTFPGTELGGSKPAPGGSAGGFDELAYLRYAFPRSLIRNGFHNAAAACTRDMADADLPSARAVATELWNAICIVGGATRILGRPDVGGSHETALRRRAYAYKILDERSKARADEDRLWEIHDSTVAKSSASFTAEHRAEPTAKPGSGAPAGSSSAANSPRFTATAGGVSHVTSVAYNGGLSEEDAVKRAVFASREAAPFRMSPQYNTPPPAADPAAPAAPSTAALPVPGSALPSLSRQTAAAAAALDYRLKGRAILPPTDGLHFRTPMQSPDRTCAQGYHRPNRSITFPFARSRGEGCLGSPPTAVSPEYDTAHNASSNAEASQQLLNWKSKGQSTTNTATAGYWPTYQYADAISMGKGKGSFQEPSSSRSITTDPSHSGIMQQAGLGVLRTLEDATMAGSSTVRASFAWHKASSQQQQISPLPLSWRLPLPGHSAPGWKKAMAGMRQHLVVTGERLHAAKVMAQINLCTKTVTRIAWCRYL